MNEYILFDGLNATGPRREGDYIVDSGGRRIQLSEKMSRADALSILEARIARASNTISDAVADKAFYVAAKDLYNRELKESAARVEKQRLAEIAALVNDIRGDYLSRGGYIVDGIDWVRLAEFMRNRINAAKGANQ